MIVKQADDQQNYLSNESLHLIYFVNELFHI